MNEEDIRNGYESGNNKFREYLELFGGASQLSKRADKIWENLKDNNIECLAILHKHGEALLTSLHEMFSRDDSDKATGMNLILKTYIVLLDSLAYLKYIDEKIFPEELKLKNYKIDRNLSDDILEMAFPVPQEIVEAIKRSREERKNRKMKKATKKNGKK